MNGLFFDDDTMHELYESKGEYDLAFQLPKIIYSSVISMVLNSILQNLALSSDPIIDFKQNKSKKDIPQRKIALLKKLKRRFILYIIFSFIFLLFCWYYISMFDVIYKNTQYHLLKDTLVSFGLSFLDPFFINIFPSLFRIISLSNPKKNRKCLYIISRVFDFF